MATWRAFALCDAHATGACAMIVLPPRRRVFTLISLRRWYRCQMLTRCHGQAGAKAVAPLLMKSVTPDTLSPPHAAASTSTRIANTVTRLTRQIFMPSLHDAACMIRLHGLMADAERARCCRQGIQDMLLRCVGAARLCHCRVELLASLLRLLLCYSCCRQLYDGFKMRHVEFSLPLTRRCDTLRCSAASA